MRGPVFGAWPSRASLNPSLPRKEIICVNIALPGPTRLKMAIGSVSNALQVHNHTASPIFMVKWLFLTVYRAGQITSEAGNDQCWDCPSGQYSPVEGGTTCENCQSGHYQVQIR